MAIPSDDLGLELFDGREMLMVHNMMRREFGLLPGIVAGTTPDERVLDDRTEIIARHIDWLIRALHSHHRTEDAYIWPLLDERCDQSALTALMEHQHEDVATCLSTIEETLKAWRENDTLEARDALKNALQRLLTPLRQHLSDEEQHLVPLMERYITAAEMSRIVGEETAHIEPAELSLLLGMLMYEGDPDIIDRVVATMPPEVGTTIHQVAAQAFAMHCQQVHGTSTPPRSTHLVRIVG
jgi:hemerythrin-like domain-containing protein